MADKFSDTTKNAIAAIIAEMRATASEILADADQAYECIARGETFAGIGYGLGLDRRVDDVTALRAALERLAARGR